MSALRLFEKSGRKLHKACDHVRKSSKTVRNRGKEKRKGA